MNFFLLILYFFGWVQWAVGSNIQPQSSIFYLSYSGGGSSDLTPDATPINNLDIIEIETGKILAANILNLGLLHPKALSFRSMVVVDDLLYVLSARTSQSRLLVSDQSGEDETKIAWDQISDSDYWFKHPYGLAYTPPYNPQDFLPSSLTSRTSQDPPLSVIYRRFFASNQNTTSITWYDIDVTSSHVYRHGLLSNHSGLQAVRGLAYDPTTMLLYLASKGNSKVFTFDIRASLFSTSADGYSPQITPVQWLSSVSSPTGLLIDPPSRRIFIGSDDPDRPAVYAYDLDAGTLLMRYIFPNSTQKITGPSGISLYNSTLYVASRSSKSIYMWNVNSAQYEGIFIENLPDTPECLYLLVPARFDFPSHMSLTQSPAFILITIFTSLLLIFAIVCVVAGTWRFWKIEQQRSHFAYQVIPWDES